MATQLAEPGLDLGRLWRWWLDELRGMLPWSSRRAAIRPDAVIVLYERGSARVAVRRRRGLNKLGTVRLGDGTRDEPGSHLGEPVPAAILRAVRQSRLPVMLRLPAATGLVCRDLLPATAERDLSVIMAHKLDILTPWSADQVHFDQRIEERRPDGQLDVSIVVAPRAAVAEARRRLAAVGIEPRGVDLVEDDPWAAPTVDLLHAVPAASRRPRWLLPVVIPVMIAVVAGGVVLTQLILERQGLIAERRSHAEALEQHLADVPELRTTLDALRNETRFVAQQQRQAVSPLVVLEALSRLLPDTVWLSDLSLQGNMLTINGFADDAPAVVALVEGSPFFSNAEFRSPSTRERVPLPDGSERDVSRFTLAAQVEPTRTIDP
jgi:general secretion pathway protein L